MTTSENSRKRERRDWLDSQSDQVRLNSVLVERLVRCISDKTFGQVAMHLVACMKNRVWEQGHWDVALSGEFYAHTYENGVEFIRERLKVQPAQLMNMITGVPPDPAEAANAAIELIREVKSSEPETFALMVDPNNTKNWRELLASNERREGGSWAVAVAELDRVSYGKRGDNLFSKAPVDVELLGQVKALYAETGNFSEVGRQLGLSRRTIACYVSGVRVPRIGVSPKSSRKQRPNARFGLRRKLERYAASSELCIERGTTVERVKQALIDLHNGKPAATCVREAGLSKPSELFNRNKQLRVAGDPDDIAKRLLSKVGATSAKAIADALKRKLNSN